MGSIGDPQDLLYGVEEIYSYTVECVKISKGQPMGKHRKLTREQIVKAATELVEQYGDTGFSMRKLARELGVDPMAIYYHHANRNALVGEVVQAFLKSCPIPKPSGDWHVDVYAMCHSFRTLAKAHPNLFRLYETYEGWAPAETGIQEAFYASLQNAGFRDQSLVRSVRLLLNYTEAFIVDEIA